MCNAYAMKIPPAALVQSFAQFRIPLIFPEGTPNAEPTEMVRPTDPALLIQGVAGGQAALSSVRWGLPPSAPKRPLLINMRSEGRSFTTGRALVPASWFYEYTGAKYPKTRWTIAPVGSDFITLAALCKSTPDGPRFTLLTVDAGPDIVTTHPRQPAVVASRDWAAWLDPAVPTPPLHPSPAGSFQVFETASA
ncbi:MAG: SOS response-associated peptidase [Alphaproteobacteria bacterium]|nr:SOS response-associated peptidase [Alphaproteobacteria bacterium]MBU2377644.1 SOS response-associated peptidase [Alphaproteobacteria bacterium]